MDEFNNIESTNENSEQTVDNIVYDATEYEYEIKLAKLKKRNRILFLVSIIAVCVCATVILLIVLKVNKMLNFSYDYYTSTDTEVSSDTGTHFAEKFTDYKKMQVIQTSSEGKTPLTPTQVYNNCINSTVTVYSYERNQIQNPSVYATGTVLTSDGYIITNQHVTSGFTNYTIKTHDNKEYEALLVGEDEKTDLAVLKAVDAILTPAELGYVSQMQVGQTVYAIGNPSGLSGSLTTGIISSLSRTIETLDPYTISHLQIDAAVNTGNSGGELINEYGQVIGIVDSKFVADHAEGIGFAISIDEAKPIIESLIENGKVTGRVRLGITYTNVSPEKAKLTGQETGLTVTAISNTLPVKDSGLQVGDIITQINGLDATNQEDFRKMIRKMKVGDEVTMIIKRNGEEKTIKTQVGAYDE